jgi:hypothetical protein
MKEALKSIWWLIINIGYLVAILFLGLFLFTIPAQSDDFVYSFTQDFELDYVLAVYLTLPFWCWVTWYSACIILQIDPIQPSLVRRNKRIHLKLSLLVPKIAGIIPCVILLTAITFVPNVTATNYQLIHIISLGVMIVIMWGIFTVNDRVLSTTTVVRTPNLKRIEPAVNAYDHPRGFFRWLRYLKGIRPVGGWPTFEEVDQFKELTGYAPTIPQEMIFIAQFKAVKFYFVVLGVIAFALTLLFCFPSVNLFLSSWLRPASILILTIPCLTLLLTIVFYFHNYTTRPFGVILVIVVVAFSYWNDNTALEYMENNRVQRRLSVEEAFTGWLATKRSVWKDTHDSATMPVIFIATQGGGIRALNWTTRVLHHLDSVYHGFIEQTFVISGVSGGGVGAATYLSFLHDFNTGQIKGENADSLFKQFTRQDFLSPLTASLAFGDNLQKFIPWPIASLERSKILGMTWEKYYKDILGTDTFSDSFLGLWYGQEQPNYDLPSLILNGTLAENGQRVITSNLEVRSAQWFSDDIDFFHTSGRDINCSFAALNCCRFPIVTSGALLDSAGYRKGHIIDGGYRENTGLQTIYNLYKTVEDKISNPSPDSIDIRLVIIYLQNGKDELHGDVSAVRILHDARTPLQGVLNVNGTTLTAKAIVQLFHQSFDYAYPPNVEFHVLSLDDRKDKTIKLPLGWYMSDTVSVEIDKRVRNIQTIDAALVASLNRLFGEAGLEAGGDRLQAK